MCSDQPQAGQRPGLGYILAPVLYRHLHRRLSPVCWGTPRMERARCGAKRPGRRPSCGGVANRPGARLQRLWATDENSGRDHPYVVSVHPPPSQRDGLRAQARHCSFCRHSQVHGTDRPARRRALEILSPLLRAVMDAVHQHLVSSIRFRSAPRLPTGLKLATPSQVRIGFTCSTSTCLPPYWALPCFAS